MFLPGCPHCHRRDRVTLGADARSDPRPGSPGARRVWDDPNYTCTACDLRFRFDDDARHYGPYRVRDFGGRVHAHLFDAPLGPGDANEAWAAATKRISDARAEDAGTNPFEVFGGLKRASTLLMKGALATRGYAPERASRNDEMLTLLRMHLGWDTYAAMSNFSDRLTQLLYGWDPVSGDRTDRERKLSPERLREEAISHLGLADALLRHLRDDDALPSAFDSALRQDFLHPPRPVALPSDVTSLETTSSLRRLMAGLDDRSVVLDFSVTGHVSAVFEHDEPSRGPLVVLRVPLNGLWWEDERSFALSTTTADPSSREDDPSDLRGRFVDLVLRWGGVSLPPALGAWVQVRPVSLVALEAVEPEGAGALAHRLLTLPPHDGNRDDVEYKFRALPPIRPRARWHREAHDGERAIVVWPAFDDDPEIGSFFGDPSDYQGSPRIPELFTPPLRRTALYGSWRDEYDGSYIDAAVHFEQERNEILWFEVRVSIPGWGFRRLGPALAFDATSYARA